MFLNLRFWCPITYGWKPPVESRPDKLGFTWKMLFLLTNCRVLGFLLSLPGFGKPKPRLSESLDQFVSFISLIEIQIGGIV